MNRNDTVGKLKSGHERLRKIISHLNESQMTELRVLGDWTVKDVLAHLSAWNSEQTRAIDEILNDQKPSWWGIVEKEFNQREVEKRKDYKMEEMIKEWEESFKNLISRVNQLSNEAWVYEACGIIKNDLPISIQTMFAYEYRNEDHEGGHAKQIEEFFKN